MNLNQPNIARAIVIWTALLLIALNAVYPPWCRGTGCFAAGRIWIGSPPAYGRIDFMLLFSEWGLIIAVAAALVWTLPEATIVFQKLGRPIRIAGKSLAVVGGLALMFVLIGAIDEWSRQDRQPQPPETTSKTVAAANEPKPVGIPPEPVQSGPGGWDNSGTTEQEIRALLDGPPRMIKYSELAPLLKQTKSGREFLGMHPLATPAQIVRAFLKNTDDPEVMLFAFVP